MFTHLIKLRYYICFYLLFVFALKVLPKNEVCCDLIKLHLSTIYYIDMIGEGTFSRVYKGEFQGSEVAVKQLKIPLQQSDKNYFAAEVYTVSMKTFDMFFTLCVNTILPKLCCHGITKTQQLNVA